MPEWQPRSGDRATYREETSSQIWAERYDRDVQEIFALQDEITAMVGAIRPVISDAELERILRKPPAVLMHGRRIARLWHGEAERGRPDASNGLFSRAIELDLPSRLPILHWLK